MHGLIFGTFSPQFNGSTMSSESEYIKFDEYDE